MLNKLPSEFIENVSQVCGGRGSEWLRELPCLISDLEAIWGILVGPHFADLSYNFVAPALKDEVEVVLKLGLPVDDREIHGEAAYLRYLNGDGTVTIIAEDVARRALLLARASPGHDLRTVFSDDPIAAVDAAIGVLKRLRRTPPLKRSSFMDLKSWTGKLGQRDLTAFPRQYSDRALSIFEESSAAAERLLHGDFHHANLLSSGASAFLAIDPKGIIGDIKYDLAVFLNNHYSWLKKRPDALEQLDHAVKRFSVAFETDPIEIRRWSYAQKVLAALWSLQDRDGRWRDQLASADIWDV